MSEQVDAEMRREVGWLFWRGVSRCLHDWQYDKARCQWECSKCKSVISGILAPPRMQEAEGE